MPEYSSTTITPVDGVQVPSMNGSTAGNILLSALKSYMLSGAGQANGLATLGSDGKLTAAQLPDLADDVIVVTTYANLPSPGTAAKIYITADTNKGYRWDPELTTPGYVKIFEMDKSIVFGYYSSGSFYEDSEHTVQITPVEHVFYVDVSLADIYVLDDGTLIELLGTKWAKITDIQDGTIQAGVATKAWQDILGRAIITTYETKADASDLKSALQATNKRVTNLEQKAGDELPVDYPSPTYGMDEVPPNVAEYAKVVKLRGVTRGHNQQMPIVSSFSRYSNGVTYVSDGNGKYSISGLASGISETQITGTLVFPKGHRFLIATTKPMSYDTARIIVWVNNSQTAGVYYGGTGPGTSDSALLFTINDSWNNETLWFNVPNGKNPSISDLQIIIRDLTQYFSSDPSVDVSTLTISDIQSNYPKLLIPSDYDAGSLVSTTYGGVKSYKTDSTELDTLSLPSPVELRGVDTSRDYQDPETGILKRSRVKVKYSGGSTILVNGVSFNISNKDYTSVADGSSCFNFAIDLTTKYFKANSDVPSINNYNLGFSNPYGSKNNVFAFKQGTDQKIAVNISGLTTISDYDTQFASHPLEIEGVYYDAPYDEQLTPVLDPFVKTEGGGTIETIQTQTPVIDNSLDVGYLAL